MRTNALDRERPSRPIDPTRFPEVVGQTCDITIVEAKSIGERQADPVPVGVTGDGPQTQAFGGTTIHENLADVQAFVGCRADGHCF